MTKPDISEWIAKAEGDYTTALREFRAPGESAERDDAIKAVSAMKSFRTEILRILGFD